MILDFLIKLNTIDIVLLLIDIFWLQFKTSYYCKKNKSYKIFDNNITKLYYKVCNKKIEKNLNIIVNI